MPPLPKQGKQLPQIQKRVRGEITQGAWEQKVYAAKRFKKEA